MRTIILEREWFVDNDAGDNEFNYLLEELGIGKNDNERAGIDEVEIKVNDVKITVGELDYTEGGE